jgi:hypothetical protein
MFLAACRTLTRLIVAAVVPTALYAQGASLSVYVADFRSDYQVDPKLLTRMTDDFEFLLSESGSYSLLERRRIGDLKDAIRNEANLRDDPQLVRQLRSRGVDAVLFGRLQDDVDAYALYATLVRLDSSIVWKRTSSLSRSLILNREHRLEALRKLLPAATVTGPPMDRSTREFQTAGRWRITCQNRETETLTFGPWITMISNIGKREGSFVYNPMVRRLILEVTGGPLFYRIGGQDGTAFTAILEKENRFEVGAACRFTPIP